jgi:DNA-binding response OmpR family regulator
MSDPNAAPSAGEAGWLIVEDEALVAMALEDAFSECGERVVGPFARVAQALSIAQSGELSGAVLDVNIAGEPVYPIAEVLRARAIPFAFITGYGRAGLREDFRDCPVLQKPFLPDQVRQLIESLRRSR